MGWWTFGFLFLGAVVIFIYYCARYVLNSELFQMMNAVSGQPEVTFEDFVQLENQTKVQEVQSNALTKAVSGSYEMLKQAAKNMNVLKRDLMKLEERLKLLEQKEEEQFMMGLSELDQELSAQPEAPALAPIEETEPAAEVQPEPKPEVVEPVAEPAVEPVVVKADPEPPVVVAPVKPLSKSFLMTKKSAQVREIAEEVIAATGGPPPTSMDVALMSKQELVDFVLDRQQRQVK